MKSIITLLLVTSSFVLKAQEEKKDAMYFKNTESKITSLKYTSNSVSELKSIKWEELKEIFETNKPKEKIELSFEVNLKESKNKLKSSFTVSGETKSIDSLIVLAKKGVNGLIRISRKYQNK